jgi:dTDP-4-amino-4,6-dideoxygalactose transaminase
VERHGGEAGAPLIPFNRAVAWGQELRYVEDAAARGRVAAGGRYGGRCADWLEARTGARAFLTPSCTHALELAALLADVEPGDEVIMPSWTFVSTATAFVLRGAVPVWVDIRPDTLNLDETALEDAITPRTRAIVPVHYAGIGCEMEAIAAVARRHALRVIEDAAHCLLATYRGRPLGTFGDIGCLSFDEMKNATAGEGGALLTGDEQLAARAEVLQLKGTNRAAFLRGEVDEYTWVDVGSSFALSELAASFLWGQLEEVERMTARRHEIWARYHEALADLEEGGALRRPVVPAECGHNAHLYYLLLRDRERRDGLIGFLAERGVTAVFHYVPLHSSPAGSHRGRAAGELPVTESVADCLVRLPLFPDLSDEAVERVVEGVRAAVG